MNTIISAYRNRKACLNTFLRSLYLSGEETKSKYEVVITDLNSTDGSEKIFDLYKDKMNLKVFKVKYSGPFWKTKALNHCASKASGDLITMLDIDSMVLPGFLGHVDDFFRKNKKTKLAHRVRFVNSKMSGRIKKNCNSLTKKELYAMLCKNINRHKLALERYTKKEIKLQDLPSSMRSDPAVYQSKALGNSHFTMPKDDFMKLGGFDERFIGHGLEDLDFNLRAFRYFKKGTLRPNSYFTVYHISHKHEKNWLSEKLRENNRVIYRKNKNKKVICLPIDPEKWGIF